MDRFWEYDDWTPTDAMMNIEPDLQPGKMYIEQARTNLIEAATRAKQLPYWQRPWLGRSAELLNLGFPDLAVVDAHKALMLCNTGLDCNSPIGEYVRVVNGMHWLLDGSGESVSGTRLPGEIEQRLMMDRCVAYKLQIQALIRLDATPDLISVCLEAIELYPEDIELQGHLREAREVFHKKVDLLQAQSLSFHDFKRRLVYGGWSPNLYPWMPSQYRVRSASVIQAANQELKTCSNNLEIRHSPIQGHDCYGLFATRHIRAGEKVLDGTLPFAVSPEQGITQCYNCFRELASCAAVQRFGCCLKIGYCSLTCQSNAKKHYHDAICGLDFSGIINRCQQLYGGKAEGSQYGKNDKTELSELTGWPDKPCKGYPNVERPLPDQTPVVLIRALAMCLQNGGHPLEHPMFAGLVQGPSMVLEKFSLNGMVIAPLKALLELGVDIFANERYDTWVLRTIWMRIANNASGSDRRGFPNWTLGLFCWFNHSCDPNVTRGRRGGILTDEDKVARRDIEKEEEAFVSYIDVSADKAARAMDLMAWFGEECKCERCKREV